MIKPDPGTVTWTFEGASILTLAQCACKKISDATLFGNGDASTRTMESESGTLAHIAVSASCCAHDAVVERLTATVHVVELGLRHEVIHINRGFGNRLYQGLVKGLPGQVRKVAEENCADIIAGDFNSSAYRERGKAGVSLIKGTWEETMLLPPSGAVPMWCQMKETEDCCGFIITKKNEPSWRVAEHGSVQLNEVKMQIKETDQAAHFSVYMYLCEAQTVERSIRCETAKSFRKQR